MGLKCPSETHMLKEGLAVSLCLPLDCDRTVRGVALWEEVMGSLLSCVN